MSMNYLKENHLETLGKELIRLSNHAANEIIKIYNSDFQIDIKHDNSPVTLADKVSESIILEGISKIEPNIDVISEEKYFEEENKVKSDYFFLIDPLDGTREFIKKNDEFTINIALVKDNIPLMGIINVPALNTIYYSFNTKSAYRMDKKKSIEQIFTRKQEPETMLYSRSKLSKRMEEILQKLSINSVLNCGSALKFCLLSEGKADFYIRHDPCYEWDTAAGQAILAAAGGSFYNINFTNFEYNKPNFLNQSGFIALANDHQKGRLKEALSQNN